MPMNMTDGQLLTRRKQLLGGLRTYYDVPFHPVRGQGVWMFEADGRKVLDAYNNVAHVGHCHPYVVETMHRQAAALNTNSRYLSEPILEYADRLIGTIGSQYECMFTCTGSEANDLAWRLATTYTGNRGAITTEHGYHGNTTLLASIDASSSSGSASAGDWWVRVPAPPDAQADEAETATTPEQYAASYAEAVARLSEAGHRPALIFLEPYFCTDGVRLANPGYVNEALATVRRAGGLVVADEVQAGLSRSGTHVWSFQRLGIDPDIVVLGKPMGNGHPIGVVVARSDIVDTFYRVDRYFNTFAGNPVSCAVGIAVLDVVERESLQQNAQTIGRRIVDELRTHFAPRFPVIGEVRGQGLLVGVAIVDAHTRSPSSDTARWIINEMCRRGVLIGTTGPAPSRGQRSILKIRPPMTFDDTAVGTLLAALEATLREQRKQR